MVGRGGETKILIAVDVTVQGGDPWERVQAATMANSCPTPKGNFIPGVKSEMSLIGSTGMRITTQAGCLVAPFPSHMPQRKVKFNPSIHLSNCAFRTGRGGTLPDPSRQAARALEACDLIKIIVLMQTHKCQGDREGHVQLLCSARPRRLGARGLRGHGQTAQPFGSFPAYSGLWHFPQKLFFFFS